MDMSNNKEERRLQKEILKGLYSDYDAKRHDVFVSRYNKEQEEKAINEYMHNRGINLKP